MTRVLGIIGSPRRNGNTHILVSRILGGASDAGAIVDAVFLGDLTIRECDGCQACWSGKPCPKNDDMNKLYPLIAQSDVIVFGTPVYWYGPTALMKAFIDRFVYFNCPENREKIKGRSAVLAAPLEEDNLAGADLLVKFFEKCIEYLQMTPAGTIVVPGVTRKGEILQRPQRLQEAHDLGVKLASGTRV